MEFDVTIDRDKYIGGSDIPIIMGISPFTSRWELLLEKAGLKERDFQGNKYTEYGHIIEPKIRAYLNEKYNTNFEPNRVINGDFRYHADGFNGKCVAEFKSTSQIHDTVDEYKIYLVQLVKGMEENKAKKGLLAVYDRPEDFSEEFDPDRLQEFPIRAKDYTDLLAEVNFEIDRFRSDLAALKENPLMTEEDFLPKSVVEAANKVAVLECRMAEYKAIEAEYKSMKQALYEAMAKYNIKSWETLNGTKITRTDPVQQTEETVQELDAELLKKEMPKVYEKYLCTFKKINPGKAGYVRVTFQKG
jgi:hypothetical protein